MVSQSSQQSTIPSSAVSGNDYDNDVEVLEASIERAVTSVMNNGDIFVVETANTHNNNNQSHMVIEGVKTNDDKRRAVCFLFLGCIALASIAATAIVAIISSGVPPYGSHSIPPTLVPMIPGRNSTMAYTSVSSCNENSKIANVLADSRGLSVSMVPGGRLFIELMNRTDTNFTFFGIDKDAGIPDSSDSFLVSKLVSPLWSSHVVRSSIAGSRNCALL